MFTQSKICFHASNEMADASVNPCNIADLPRNKKRMKAFSPEQAKRFLGIGKRQQTRLNFGFCFGSGMRPEEYLALKWSDIDFAKHAATVQRTLIWRKGGGWYFAEPENCEVKKNLAFAGDPSHRVKSTQKTAAEHSQTRSVL
jgi:integrase